METTKIINRISELRTKFLATSDLTEKAELQQKIENLLVKFNHIYFRTIN